MLNILPSVWHEQTACMGAISNKLLCAPSSRKPLATDKYLYHKFLELVLAQSTYRQIQGSLLQICATESMVQRQYVYERYCVGDFSPISCITISSTMSCMHHNTCISHSQKYCGFTIPGNNVRISCWFYTIVTTCISGLWLLEWTYESFILSDNHLKYIGNLFWFESSIHNSAVLLLHNTYHFYKYVLLKYWLGSVLSYTCTLQELQVPVHFLLKFTFKFIIHVGKMWCTCLYTCTMYAHVQCMHMYM